MVEQNSEGCQENLAKRLSVKKKIDSSIFNEFKKAIKGDIKSQKKALQLFFKNYPTLPHEADAILIEFAKQTENMVLIRLIAQSFVTENTHFSAKFELGLLGVLSKKEDKITQKIIEAKMLQYQEQLDNIRKVLAKSINYYNKTNENLVKIIQFVNKKSFEDIVKISENINTSLIRDSISEFNKIQQTVNKMYFTPHYSSKTITQLMVPQVTLTKDEQKLVNDLTNCPKGKNSWKKYEDICGKVIQYLFSPPLGDPIAQDRSDDGVHIRDYILQIPYNDQGFWGRCQILHNSVGVVFEIKNKAQLKPNDIVVTSKYLHSKRTGNFGIIISRECPPEKARHELERIWKEDDKLIVIITDKELIDMIKLKSSKDDPEKLIEKIIFNFRSSLD